MTRPPDQDPKSPKQGRWKRLSDPPPTWNYILGWYALAIPMLAMPVLPSLLFGDPARFDEWFIGLRWWEFVFLLIGVLLYAGAIYGLVNVTRAWRHARRKLDSR